LQAARFYGRVPPDFRRVSAASIGDRVAVARYGTIDAASSDTVGYAVESARRIVFVVQVEPGAEWACAALDDNATGTAGPVFGRAGDRSAISTYAGCVAHP
jgi:hypothetical protein